MSVIFSGWTQSGGFYFFDFSIRAIFDPYVGPLMQSLCILQNVEPWDPILSKGPTVGPCVFFLFLFLRLMYVYVDWRNSSLSGACKFMCTKK